jgi:nicotinic acid phosphoribosyltransferase
MILNVKLAIEGWRDSFDAVHIRLVFAYTVVVPTARSCSVSFTDSEGITHSVEITASTLYEAAVLALSEFRRCGFAEATFGPGTKLSVKPIRYKRALWKFCRDLISSDDAAIFEPQTNLSRYQTTQPTKAPASAERQCLRQSSSPCSR